MSIQDYVIAGEKMGVHNHQQMKVSKLEKQCPGVIFSVLKFSGYEAIRQPWKYTIELTSPTSNRRLASLLDKVFNRHQRAVKNLMTYG